MSEESQGLSERQSMYIAQVPQFQSENEPLENYIDRLTAFLEVKVSENEKVNTLTAVIGAKAYAILKYINLLPEKSTDKRYVDLIEILKKHYSGELILSERFKFNRRSQLPTETIAEYILTLKQLSVTCDYGEFLDQTLRDRLIAGLNNKLLIKKLLAKPANMSFAEACKICLNFETSLPGTSKIKSKPNQQDLKTKSNIRRLINKSNRVRCKQNIANRCPTWRKQLCFRIQKKRKILAAYRARDNGKSPEQRNEDQFNTGNITHIKIENMLSSNQGNVPTGSVQSQQLVPRERQYIWQGIVEWIEKAKNPTDAQKQTRHIPCQVSANAKDGDPELKADTWPPKLIMQLMPKQLIGSIGGTYLKNSKSVVFHPTPCEALESLTKMMTAGFAGCVHFTSASSSPACEIKVLILLYTTDKKKYLGFIPNDQTAFVDRLRKVIQQQKTSQNASVRQANPGLGNTIPAPMTTQGGIFMSQTNTMAMGGGQITQNVVSTAPPQTLTSTSGPQTQMNMQNSGIGGPQANAGVGSMIGQQRPPFDDLEIARHQNLLKSQHLTQTLEAAQQQYKAQYKSHLEVNILQNLEVAQQEMQYEQQLEAQQAQAQRGLNPAAMANQQANCQRLMRPVFTNNLGLRHLLQQPPQYSVRQVFGVQQQMVGPRGQIATRSMAPGNTQNQQFEDVSNYDFLS